MKDQSSTKVFFHEFKKPEDKLLLLFRIAARYFHTRRPLQILASSLKVAQFVDRSLWQNPSFSFLPHEIGSSSTTSIHILTEEDTSHKYTLNLTAKPLTHSYLSIHEFEDGSDSSKEKYHFYKEKGYNIILI